MLSLSKADPAVARQDRIPSTDQPVAVAEEGGHPRELEPALFSWTQDAARIPERRLEERADVMRLKTPGRRSVHLLAHAPDRHRIEPLARELAPCDQCVDVVHIDRAVDRPEEPLAYLVLLPVADRFHEQLPQRPRLEQLAQHIVDLAPQGSTCRLQLL